MLEFLMFLSGKERALLELLYKANFSVEENTPLCLLGKKYFGFYKKDQKTIVICTKNAIDVGGYFLPRVDHRDNFHVTNVYIRRALRHEAVHVAQSCKKGNILSQSEINKLKLHPNKKKALLASTKLSGNINNEIEAYWMEDRPRLVKNAVEKYCL